MQWIKSHLNVVITSSLALVAVVLLVLGMVLPHVAADMKRDQSVIATLGGIQAVNGAVIQHEQNKVETNKARLEKMLKELEATGNHQPLVTDVFPKIDSTKPAPYQFKNKYKEKQQQLLTTLRAMDQPSKADIDLEAERLADKKAREETQKVLGADQPGAPGRKPPPGGAAPAARRFVRPTPQALKEMTPEERLREDPVVRASMQRARSVYCYGTLTSLDPRSAITETSSLPAVEDLWYAQMSLWIQEDVLGALAQLNNRAAEQLPEKDKWVAHLPVKRLINIWIGGYVPDKTAPGGGAARGLSAGSTATGTGPPPGDAASVFTQRGSAGKVDVIQFALNLVVEAQKLPAVIDEICKAGFYTPLLVTYEGVSPVTELTGFVYGSAPVIQVRLEYEGCFLRNKYAKWMPETVALAIKEGRAGGQSQQGPGYGGSPGARPGAVPSRSPSGRGGGREDGT